jgi:sugar lactone lactonase YvrE
MLARILAAVLVLIAAPALAQSTCGHRLFVSGWFTTVYVYDACTGAFLRELDGNSRLNGAMAVRLGPDGLIYAVAETTGAIQMYRNDTLDFVGTFTNVAGIGATGLVFDAAGIAYVAGYDSDDVRKFDRQGNSLGAAFPARSSGLNGPDSGMTWGHDGNLYIPGYDSSNVVRFDPRTGLTSVAVAPAAGGLFQTRGILQERDNHRLFITSEGSGRLMRWDMVTGELVTLRTGLNRPTGIDYAPDGNLFVTHGIQVIKVNPANGETISTFLQGNGVGSQVFLSVLAVPSAAAGANYTSLWWKADESGWGINVNHQGNLTFATLFTYDALGQPMWLVSTGARTTGDTFTGDLLRTTGPAFDANPFTALAASNVTNVGTMSLAFSGDTGTLTYSVNGTSVVKPITKQVFGSRAATCNTTTADRATATNYQDLWWAGAGESGWGINLTHQGDAIFATLFTYAAGSGTANTGLWLVSSLARQSDGSYTGALLRTTGPAFNANPFTPIGGANVTTVGTMTARFTNGQAGTLTYTVNGSQVTKSITRQTFSSPMPSCVS